MKEETKNEIRRVVYLAAASLFFGLWQNNHDAGLFALMISLAFLVRK